jgi:hypothetical protein
MTSFAIAIAIAIPSGRYTLHHCALRPSNQSQCPQIYKDSTLPPLCLSILITLPNHEHELHLFDQVHFLKTSFLVYEYSDELQPESIVFGQ